MARHCPIFLEVHLFGLSKLNSSIAVSFYFSSLWNFHTSFFYFLRNYIFHFFPIIKTVHGDDRKYQQTSIHCTNENAANPWLCKFRCSTIGDWLLPSIPGKTWSFHCPQNNLITHFRQLFWGRRVGRLQFCPSVMVFCILFHVKILQVDIPILHMRNEGFKKIKCSKVIGHEVYITEINILLYVIGEQSESERTSEKSK